MTLYGYARVSVRDPEDKNLDLQVERLVRAGCSLGNIRAEEASGARNDRGGLLELLDQLKTITNVLPAPAEPAAPQLKRRWSPFR